jgi:hypothetical protein
MICVYSRTKPRDQLPLSAPHANLVLQQQRRMCIAMQNMAAIIEKSKTGCGRYPSEFDVVDLLDQHAPHDVAKDPTPYRPGALGEYALFNRQFNEGDADARQQSSNKRRKNEDGYCSTSKLNANGQLEQPSHRLGPFRALEPLDTQPVAPDQSSQAYGTLMQIMRLRGQNAAGYMLVPVPSQGRSAAPRDAVMIRGGTNTNGNARHTESSSTSTNKNLASDAQPVNLMDLIDWDASLANFRSKPGPGLSDNVDEAHGKSAGSGADALDSILSSANMYLAMDPGS